MLLQRYYNPVFTDRTAWPATTAINDMIKQFDHMFNQAGNHSIGLPLEIYETDGHYLVRAFVPEVDAKSMELNIRDRQLHIKVTRAEADKSEEKRLLVSELPTGVLERWIQFEKDISSEATATLKEGVLTLTIPKKQVQHSIPIQVDVKTE